MAERVSGQEADQACSRLLNKCMNKWAHKSRDFDFCSELSPTVAQNLRLCGTDELNSARCNQTRDKAGGGRGKNPASLLANPDDCVSPPVEPSQLSFPLPILYPSVPSTRAYACWGWGPAFSEPVSNTKAQQEICYRTGPTGRGL